MAIQNTDGSFSGGEKIFITGITGFIGSHLAKRLTKEGYKVAGLTRRKPSEPESVKNLKSEVDIYEGDLRNASGIASVVGRFQPDAIIHMGAITPVSYSFTHPQEVTQVNYLGTINLAESARKKVPHLRKFIFSSSMEVYGRMPVQEPFTEDMVVHPNCPYAVAKHASEKFLSYLEETYDFPTISLRQTNCYGRKHNDYFVVEAFITQMINNENEVNFGNPDPFRNFIHIHDIVEMYVNILEEGGEDMFGEVYNTGPANAIQIRELAEKIKSLTGFKGDINWRTREMREGEVSYLNSSNEKLKKKIPWKPNISLNEGLESGVKYWKDNLQG